ncbi:MAG: RluA family pseudouridine synthase [Bacteroidia bacterium]|nr:RluA family pseudouridine synthase [Bacteroidia bacterium]
MNIFPEERILFEDNHLLIVNKLPGELVQKDTEQTPALEDVLKEYLKEKYQKSGEAFLGVVHRLDRPTSGIVIFAKTSKALTRLNEDFKTRNIKKIYWAVVKNKPRLDKEKLTHYLLRNSKNNTSKAFNKEIKGSKLAELIYTVINSSDNYYLLEIELLTGRHHQIRAQLAAINCSIKGDLKYGSPRSNNDGSIHLHAQKVVFTHPVKKEEITIVASPPNDNLWNFLKTVEN